MLFKRGMYCHGLHLIPGQPPAATSSHPLFMYIYFIDTTLHSFPLCATTQIHSRSFSDRYTTSEVHKALLDLCFEFLYFMMCNFAIFQHSLHFLDDFLQSAHGLL